MKSSSRISLKKANFSDIEFLWYLRNQPDVYRYSANNRSVKWEEHINWITPVILGLSKSSLFVIKNKGVPIGQIRFDYINDNDEVVVSISTLKELRGKGISTEAFRLAIKEIQARGKIKKIIANIHKRNLPSIKFFERFNFKLKDKKGFWLKYILEI